MQSKLSGKEYGRKYSRRTECGCKATNQARWLPIEVMLIIVTLNSLWCWYGMFQILSYWRGFGMIKTLV